MTQINAKDLSTIESLRSGPKSRPSGRALRPISVPVVQRRAQPALPMPARAGCHGDPGHRARFSRLRQAMQTAAPRRKIRGWHSCFLNTRWQMGAGCGTFSTIGAGRSGAGFYRRAGMVFSFICCGLGPCNTISRARRPVLPLRRRALFAACTRRGQTKLPNGCHLLLDSM